MFFIDKYVKRFSETKKKIIKNLFWAILGKCVGLFGNLIIGIFIARYLGPTQYGLMNYVISYVTIFTIISNFGLDNIEIRELSRNGDNKEMILGTSLGLRLLFSFIAFICVFFSVFLFDLEQESRILIIIYALSIFPSAFNLIRNYFTSIVLNEYVVKSEIIRTIIGASIKITLLLFNAPIILFIVASFLDFVLVASGYIVSYTSHAGLIKKWHFDISYAKFLVLESFPLVLSGAAVIIYQKIDQIMIAEMIDKTNVGYYATAGQFINIAMFIPIILVQTLTPILVRVKDNNPNLYENKKVQFISLLTWASIIIALIISVIANPLIKITFGERYLPAVPILQISIWKLVGMALSSASGQIIILEGIQKWTSIRNFLSCGLCILLNLLLIPQMGVIGASWASVITLLGASYMFNIVIPPYYKLMKVQTISILFGWKYCYEYLRRLTV